LIVAWLIAIVPAIRASAAEDDAYKARQVLSAALNRAADLIEPPDRATPQTLQARFKVVRADNLPAEAAGAAGELAFQAPAHLRFEATVSGNSFTICRDNNEIWIDEPGKQFAVLGKNGIARFAAEPEAKDRTLLPPFSLPLSRWQIKTLLLGMEAQLLPSEELDGVRCQILRLNPRPIALDLLQIPPGQIDLWLRQDNGLPARFIYTDGIKTNLQVDIFDAKLVDPIAPKQWRLNAAPGEKVETVALSHLVDFLKVTPRIAMEKAPSLGPATGQRKVIATEGKGRLEMIDGTRVLFLKGSPEEMGHQHGILLKREIHNVATRILYGVGVGSSFGRGSWFFGEIEKAEARLQPFMDERYLRELDAIADACQMDRQEARLANFFPELFHCSGFALMGSATKDGHMYHGRVLDYLRGVGLEQNAVVIVHQPDYGNAWVNISYAGFVGTVTAMNEKGISVGEMGGDGYGEWDGKPMAHLLREVMEKAGTLDEAIKIMRDSPRTCQYYYVVSDGNSKQAVGISANPREFITIKPGEYNALLPHPQPDSVILSAGERYETLSTRVREGLGTFDADSARALMDPPVCMTSNIQSVLFSPDTLDLWVANADGNHVASQTRYTHYNLRELLKGPPPKAPAKPAFEF
jgi:hypothetical protein